MKILAKLKSWIAKRDATRVEEESRRAPAEAPPETYERPPGNPSTH